MAKRKKEITDEKVRRSLGREFLDSHDRAQSMLAARVAHYDRVIDEKRRAADRGN